MKHIIIVNCQEDFCNPKGALYIKGAETAVENIKKYLELLKDEKIIPTPNIIFIIDWHPITHCSFKENGGQWPIHCVKYTKGASIVESLTKEAYSINKYDEIVKKGTDADEDEEEYGTYAYVSDFLPHGEIEFIVCGDDFSYASFLHDDEIIICGVAGDYCVYKTYKNLKKYGLNVIPYYDGIAFVGEKFDFEERFNAEEE